MGLRDVLFGRKQLKPPAEERLFALTTAAITLETDAGLKFGGDCTTTPGSAMSAGLRPRESTAMRQSS